MTKTVLVTGGSGFIGGWCVVELLKQGYTVRTSLRSLTKENTVRAAVAGEVDPGDRLSFCALDLTKDAGWDKAAEGCDYVLHVASPLGTGRIRHPDELIVPAREGALRALRAATKAGVERIVLTSSVAASAPPMTAPDGITDESVWTDPQEKGLHAYRQSKTLAERAAWDFMSKTDGRTTLATILPCAVLGPVLIAENLGSVQLISRLLNGSLPGYPRLGFNLVDVRDVAQMHILAMTAPEAAGQRFIAAQEFKWMGEIARLLRAELGPRARKVPRLQLPDFMLRLASIFDPALRGVTPSLGRANGYSAARARTVLGWQPLDVRTTILDCAESLIAKDAV